MGFPGFVGMASSYLKDTTTVMGLLKQPSKIFPKYSEYNPQTHAAALKLITEVLKAQNLDHCSQIITMSPPFRRIFCTTNGKSDGRADTSLSLHGSHSENNSPYYLESSSC